MNTDEEVAKKIKRIIRVGRVDDELKDIIEEAVHRRRLIQARAAYEQVQRVAEGDRIQVRSEVRPKYLAGKTGTVIQLSKRTRAGVPLVEVRLDRPVGKFRSGTVLLHGSSFELITQRRATDEKATA